MAEITRKIITLLEALDKLADDIQKNLGVVAAAGHDVKEVIDQMKKTEEDNKQENA